MSLLETFMPYGVVALVVALILLAQFRGYPASDVDRADLIEFSQGDSDAQAIVRSVLEKKHLQKIDCARAHRRIQAMRDAKHAKAVIAEFQSKA